MPYSAEISRSNPSCFLFLIDQSGSMDEEIVPAAQRVAGEFDDVQAGGVSPSRKTKAQGVADAINRLLFNLTLKCAKQEGIRDYYSVGVIGYGGDVTNTRVAAAFGGALAGRELVSISELANNPLRVQERVKKVEDGAGGLVDQCVKLPIWFDALAVGGTPMCRAFQQARDTLNAWIGTHPGSFPPIVINISDGNATDGNPTESAESLKTLGTNDGQVLLFNIGFSSMPFAPVEFPDTDATLPDTHSKLLFQLSSPLPAHLQEAASQEGLPISQESRGCAFHADMVSLIRFLDIGTRPSNLR